MESSQEVFGYFTSAFLWGGAVLAVEITTVAMAIGLLLGLVLALMRVSDWRLLRGLAWVYIWVIRGTPLLLQLVFIFDALPIVGLKFNSFVTAVIGFSLNQAAFSAEVIRGGILSVNPQQAVAASSLGMGPLTTLRRIVLPQAMRAILPALANDTIGMLKMTSVASVIFVNELTFRSQQIVGENFKFFTVFAGAGAIYLLLTSVISIFQSMLERARDPALRGAGARRRAGADATVAPAQTASERRGHVEALRELIASHETLAADQPFVQCSNVWKAYGARDVLKGVGFAMKAAEVVAVIGPSGSGKSTLLRLINHLESVDQGEIRVGGRPLGYVKVGNLLKPASARARARARAEVGVSMVFQQFNLFSHLTVLENVMEAPITVQRARREDAEALARRLLAAVGLSSHVDHMPQELSGGQQQRVAIARALAVKPRLMLFDEPTSALDPELVGEVLNVIRSLALSGMTMIIVTHEIRFARDVADRVVFFEDGEIVEEGPAAELLENPKKPRTQRFLNRIDGDAGAGRTGDAVSPLDRDALSADAVIVGAGLSGAVVARRLAEAGVDVLCLERGGWADPATFPGDAPEGELASLGPWSPSPNTRRRPGDYPIDDSASDIKPMMFNGVGGSTVLYGAQWMRFLPSDFRVRSTDGVADDWPIAYEELAPYYDRVEADFSVSGQSGDPLVPPQPDYPLPALPLTRAGERVMAGHAKLGWHCWPGSNAIASRPDKRLRACEELGVCGAGCPVGAKASVDITHWPLAQARGARLLTQCRVRRVEHDAAGRATGVVFTDAQGVERRANGRVVILAGNAIGTARLLLASRSPRFPHGLANASGLVGRRLMLHPFSRAVGLFDEPMQKLAGAWGQTVYSLEFARTRPEVGFVRGAKWNLGPSGGPLGAALFPWPGERLWGEAMHRHVEAWLGRSAVWGVICEDLPEEANRVEIDPERLDANGDPIPILRYRVSANSRAMLAYNLARAEESLQAAGASRTLSAPLLADFGWHPLGTCRMGESAQTSVVDSFGAAHDVPGLYIVDGGILPTGSCVNPAATIAALALRAADRLVATRGADA